MTYNLNQEISYKNVKEICYLKDLQQIHKNEPKGQNNNSQKKQALSQIADQLYKKIIRNGIIQQPKNFAFSQKAKKVQTMYDLNDNFIDDQQVITQIGTKNSKFSDFKAIQCASILKFYKQQILRPTQISDQEYINRKITEVANSRFQQLRRSIKQKLKASKNPKIMQQISQKVKTKTNQKLQKEQK